MKKMIGLIACVIMILFSCATTEEPAPEPEVFIPSTFEGLVDPVPEEEVAPPAPVEEKPAAAEVFDPASITQEVFDETKSDVQLLIETLNQIIRDKDYTSWRSYLGQNYLDAISDPDFLARLSESARLKSQSIVLRGPGDYFLYVVVPSRANDRVDDIEFIGEHQVKAFTITPKGQRLRLYNLETDGENWKITE
jgi:hypothetical protein